MKRLFPRIHLSTALILLVATSLLLGAQFVQQEVEHEGAIHFLRSDDSTSLFPNDDVFSPKTQYGFPFTVLQMGWKLKGNPGGYSWSRIGIAGNIVTSLALLICFGAALEYRIRRNQAS